jgi:transcriptional regulator GlxA family with amidase domain
MKRSTNSHPPRRIGFVAYEGITALDLIALYDVFGKANAVGGQDGDLYTPLIVAPTLSPITSDSGIVLQPTADFGSPLEYDTIVTPGGPGLREPSINAQVVAWLQERAPRTRRMVSVCTGLYGLAATGLLDGRRAATHWYFASDVARRFPNVNVDADILYLEDPPFFTSAGIAAGIDLGLALIEKDHGPALSLAVARMLVVYFKRPGGQLQFSEPLRFQTRAKDKFADLAAWLPANLSEDLSVEALALRANMSLRNFSRSFKSTFGTTAARYVEGLRLEAARNRLGTPNQTIESVSLSVGFRSADVFRRAFERRFGVSPSRYVRHFSALS